MGEMEVNTILNNAQRACSHSRLLRFRSQRVQRQWRAWRLAWQHASEDRVHSHKLLVVVCSYCQRVRVGEDSWHVVPGKVRERLQGACSNYVTHGLCPRCFHERFEGLINGAPAPVTR